MREVNPWALHSIAENLLEAHQRNMWNASRETVQKLHKIYILKWKESSKKLK